MSKDSVSVNNGIGAFGLLAIIFTIFKLLGKISWSWWLVLLPLYGPILFWLGFAIIILIIAVLVEIFK